MAAPKKQEKQAMPQFGEGKVDKPNVVLLWSSLASNAHQQSAQTKMSDLLTGKKCRAEQLDGSQAQNKKLRNQLFNTSNVRGKYPQIFIVNEKEEIEYIGMDDDIQYLLDSEAFDDKFGCTMPKKN